MRKVTGSWSVQSTELVAGPLTCSGFTFNDRDALRCALTTALVSAAAVGKAGTFSKGTATSPSDSRFADYK